MRRWTLPLCLSILLLVAQSRDRGFAQGAEVLQPTNVWVDFVGEGASTYDGAPLRVGDVLRAYDPTGVLAGEFVIPAGNYPAGWYGLMPVYGDDLMTSQDEGAKPGDYITFTVNGHQTVPMGPDAPLWVEAGSLAHVELRACTLAGDFDCSCQVTVADVMQQAQSVGVLRGQTGYYPPYDRDGDGDIDVGDLQEVAGRWHAACP